MSPGRPKRPCAAPGCATLVRKGRCEVHRRKRERHRGTRQERGYDRDHERWRHQVLTRDKGLCQPCLRKGVVTGPPAHRIQADHVVPFDQGGARLDPANGQTICTTCHAFKNAWEREHGPDEPWPETEAGRDSAPSGPTGGVTDRGHGTANHCPPGGTSNLRDSADTGPPAIIFAAPSVHGFGFRDGTTPHGDLATGTRWDGSPPAGGGRAQ